MSVERHSLDLMRSISYKLLRFDEEYFTALLRSEEVPRLFQEQIQGCPSSSTPVQRQEVPQEGGRDRGMAENSPNTTSSHSDCAAAPLEPSLLHSPAQARLTGILGRKETFGVTKNGIYNRLERVL